MKVSIGLVVLMAGLVVGGIMICGCESTSSTSDVLTVTPSSATLNSSNLVATFTVDVGTNGTLVLPLKWSVSNSGLGTIVSSASLEAVYQSNGTTGVNTIVVQDQASAEGAVSVIQQ